MRDLSVHGHSMILLASPAVHFGQRRAYQGLKVQFRPGEFDRTMSTPPDFMSVVKEPCELGRSCPPTPLYPAAKPPDDCGGASPPLNCWGRSVVSSQSIFPDSARHIGALRTVGLSISPIAQGIIGPSGAAVGATPPDKSTRCQPDTVIRSNVSPMPPASSAVHFLDLLHLRCASHTCEK